MILVHVRTCATHLGVSPCVYSKIVDYVTTGAQEVVAHGESGAAAGRQGGRAVRQYDGQRADRERAGRQAEGALSGQRHALTQCCILTHICCSTRTMLLLSHLQLFDQPDIV